MVQIHAAFQVSVRTTIWFVKSLDRITDTLFAAFLPSGRPHEKQG
jgi:hypothetical protein